jgi:hypothetical protein
MKIIFTPLLLLIVSVAVAQIEEQQAREWKTIGELKTLGLTKARMQFTVSGSDTSFMLFMKDFTKQPENNYFSIVFNSTGDTFSKCYTLLISFFDDENRKDKDYMKTVKLGKTMLNIQHQGLIGSAGIRLTTNDGYITLSKKDVDKLFGKR